MGWRGRLVGWVFLLFRDPAALTRCCLSPQRLCVQLACAAPLPTDTHCRVRPDDPGSLAVVSRHCQGRRTRRAVAVGHAACSRRRRLAPLLAPNPTPRLPRRAPPHGSSYLLLPQLPELPPPSPRPGSHLRRASIRKVRKPHASCHPPTTRPTFNHYATFRRPCPPGLGATRP